MKKIQTGTVAVILAAFFMLAAVSSPVLAWDAVLGMPENNAVTTISLTVGSTAFTVNGVTQEGDAAPFIADGRTMVPLRVVSEALGAEVDWDGATQTATIMQSHPVASSFALTIGRTLPNNMGTPILHGGRTFVPFRYAAERLGADVDWNGETQTVTMRSNSARITPEDLFNAEIYDLLRMFGFDLNLNAIDTQPIAVVVEESEARAFERAVFDAINAYCINRGSDTWEWDDTLSAAARWRSANNDRFRAMPFDASTLVVSVPPNNLSPDLVISELDRFVSMGIMVQTLDGLGGEPRPIRDQGQISDLIGVGYDPASGLVTVFFSPLIVANAIHDTPGWDVFVKDVGMGWFYDSPYYVDFMREHNPYSLSFLARMGYSEEEIMDIFEREMFRFTNEVRVAHGLNPVLWDDSLGRSARATAPMVLDGNHVCPDGSTPDDRARREGWQGGWVMENAGGLSFSPESNIVSWLLSRAGHRENILDPNHTHLGVGMAHENDLLGYIAESHWSINPNDRQVYGYFGTILQFGTR
ncbi:MAG: stalk domain-containing protein [Defluviitaleaceae bacterium]|nr:stalk domain-containing protein [Defluviitaleaceae bacterium]MCL2262271.1 stalk domain-containing protein [Defluviitaleaceae bacterium]